MPITVNSELEGYRANTGQADTNEVIYKLNASQTYIVDCVVEAAGTASLKLMTGTNDPVDFSAMSLAFDGTQSANFTRRVQGASFIGLDIASGTWTVKVRRV